jgi:hypothetical protein
VQVTRRSDRPLTTADALVWIESLTDRPCLAIDRELVLEAIAVAESRGTLPNPVLGCRHRCCSNASWCNGIVHGRPRSRADLRLRPRRKSVPHQLKIQVVVRLRPKRIDDFKKWEPVEIGVARADSPDSVLTHEDGRVRIMEYIPGQVWQLRNDLAGNFGIPLCRDENTEAGRSKQRRDKFPCYACAPRLWHYPPVSRDAHKLVYDWPSRVPGIGPRALTVEPVAAGRMKWRTGISRVH